MGRYKFKSMKKGTTEYFNIPLKELNISVKDIEKIAHTDGTMPSYYDFLMNEIGQLCNVVNIEAGYVIMPGYVNKDRLIVDGKAFNLGNLISRFFKGMTYAAIFVCSAGQEITDRAKQLSLEGKLIEGYLIDVLGSVMVEKAMDQVQEILHGKMKKQGLHISNRYSPGYCDWDVKEQKQLFSFLPDNFCNVSLSDSCLMIPVKSVSGVIAIGENVRFNKHVCQNCNMVNCLYRNTSRE